VFCDVVIPGTSLDALTYRVDTTVVPELAPGDCVRVKLRGRNVTGIVVAILERSPVAKVLAIGGVVERQLVTPEMLRLAHWVASYYYCRLGDVLGLCLPKEVRARLERHAEAEATVAEAAAAPVIPGELAEAVSQRRFGVWVTCRNRHRLELVGDFAAAVRRQGSVLVLLPESKLHGWLPKLASSLSNCVRGPALSDSVVEYHTRLTPAARRRAWRTLRQGRFKLVVGVRSAVFSPVSDLAGIAVVDEHEPVFKEERRPRYHARDVAIARGRLSSCPVLICDRTPSAETWYNLATGRYRWLEPPPTELDSRGVSVVDMRRQHGQVLSPLLVHELGRVQAQGKSAILYINRRGLARHVECRDCGRVLKCERCGVPNVLTAERTLCCRYCGTTTPAPDSCPDCQGSEFEFRAVGVDTVVNEISRRFPGVKVRRVLSDSRPVPESPKTEIGECPSSGTIGESPSSGTTVLVGTKALLHWEWPATVGLVAAVSADADLARSDFRSRERTFQVLYELWRRGRELGARVIVQTRRPDDVAIRCAVAGDVGRFLNGELKARRELTFPPYCRLVALEFRGGTKGVVRHAQAVAELLCQDSKVEVLGPVAHLQLGRESVMRMLVKLPRNLTLDRLIARERLEGPGVAVRVDVDPLEIL